MKDQQARDDIHAQKLNLEFSDRRLRDLRAEHGQLKEDFDLLLSHFGLMKISQISHPPGNFRPFTQNYYTSTNAPASNGPKS